jgi:Pyridoxamine 5'-phosphate oxidase
VGKTLVAIDDKLAATIQSAPLYFVATAPLAANGHVNCSPKGRDTLRVLGPKTLAWLDLPGSGAETIAHLRENGRIVVMICAFEGPPRICRFHGRGEVLTPEHADFSALLSRFPPQPAVRSIIRVQVDRIADSCGYGVPEMKVTGRRYETENFVAKMPVDGLRTYVRDNNAASIDGLPALQAAEAATVLVDRALAVNTLANKTR